MIQKIIIFILIAIQLSSCRDKNEELIPHVAVDFTIDTYSTFYNELAVVGGWVYVTGGYKGILLYRFSNDEFMAYERCCTYRPKDPCERIVMEDSGLGMHDPCCGSRFIIIDGSVVEGPAKRMLRQYYTSFDGRYLRVYY